MKFFLFVLRYKFNSKYKKALIKTFGKDTGFILYNNFIDEVKLLINSKPQIKGIILNQHLYNNIIPGIALFYISSSVYGTLDQRLAFLNNQFRIIYRLEMRCYKAISQIPYFFLILKIMTKFNMTFIYPSIGWKTTFLENNNKNIRFNIESCFYKTILEHYNCKDILQSFCKIDDLLFKKFSPNVIWERTGTIGTGSDKCDFRFINNEL